MDRETCTSKFPKMSTGMKSKFNKHARCMVKVLACLLKQCSTNCDAVHLKNVRNFMQYPCKSTGLAKVHTTVTRNALLMSGESSRAYCADIRGGRRGGRITSLFDERWGMKLMVRLKNLPNA